MLPPRSRSLFALLAEQAKRFGDRPAVISAGQATTYRQLFDAADPAPLHPEAYGLQQGLHELGALLWRQRHVDLGGVHVQQDPAREPAPGPHGIGPRTAVHAEQAPRRIERLRQNRPVRVGQDAWRPHADFMNALVADGFVLLGGPLEEPDVLLIVREESEAAIRARLAPDPWHRQGLLTIKSISPWTLRLGSLPAV